MFDVAGGKDRTPASQVRVQGCNSRLSGKARFPLSVVGSSTTNNSDALVLYSQYLEGDGQIYCLWSP